MHWKFFFITSERPNNKIKKVSRYEYAAMRAVGWIYIRARRAISFFFSLRPRFEGCRLLILGGFSRSWRFRLVAASKKEMKESKKSLKQNCRAVRPSCLVWLNRFHSCSVILLPWTRCRRLCFFFFFNGWNSAEQRSWFSFFPRKMREFTFSVRKKCKRGWFFFLWLSPRKFYRRRVARTNACPFHHYHYHTSWVHFGSVVWKSREPPPPCTIFNCSSRWARR